MSRVDVAPQVVCRPTDEWPAAVLNSVLLSSDPFAQEAAVDYWTMSSGGHRQVVRGIRESGSPEAIQALEVLLAGPDEPSSAASLEEAIREAAVARPETWSEIGATALDADALGRLALHLGSAFTQAEGPAIDASILRELERPARLSRTDDAPVLVVIPFRDRSPELGRLRNLLATLHALEDQDIDGSHYRIVVVEQDADPRWRSVIEPRVDGYLHLEWGGHFNKSWAVNAGVVQLGGSSEVICVLDADVLPDREFVSRNVARFTVRGAQAHLPFRDALCLDESSSHRAILDRVVDGGAAPSSERLRGVYLRRPPGHCVWVRRGLFERIGGFDERFEGWGGEDLDFVFRLDVVGAVDRYEDPLWHLFHPRPQTQENGRRFYAGRRLLSWRPDGPIGQLDQPAKSLDDDLSGLIERVDEG